MKKVIGTGLAFCIILSVIVISFFEKNSVNNEPTIMNQQITISDESITYLPIIMYHHISTSKKSLNNYTISPETFKGDLDYLRSHGYTTISLKQLIAFTKGEYKLPEKPIMITFDDGYASFGTYALPLLEKYNMCAVLAVIGRIAENYTNNEDHNIRYSYFSWPELATLSQSPNVELSVHTYDMHTKDKRKGCKILRGESLDSYTSAISKDLDLIESQFATYIGEKPYAFAYPYGFCCNEAKGFLRSRGYSVLFTCYERVNKLSGDPEELMSLCRFNRPSNIDRDQFFKKLIPS
jgi:peptidoglycan/xylan/chitin deacetylase (PgdA/CDA1 family)